MTDSNPYLILESGHLGGLMPVVGDWVKLSFYDKGNTETMWVKVTSVSSGGLQGTLDQDPVLLPDIKDGGLVSFGLKHIRDILHDDRL